MWSLAARELAIAISQRVGRRESHSLRLVPGLNPPALEKDHGTDDQCNPG